MSGFEIALIILASGLAVLFFGLGILLIALAVAGLREQMDDGKEVNHEDEDNYVV